MSQNVNFSKYFLSFCTIYIVIKKVVSEFFHGIELIIDFRSNFDDYALATFIVDKWGGLLIIV